MHVGFAGGNMYAPMKITLALLALTTTVGASLDYVCYPNATIVVTNPDDALYVSVLAANPNGTCTTTWLDVKARVRLTECGLDVDILVSFSSRLMDNDNIYGGANVTTYLIRCQQIDSSGVMMTFTQGFASALRTVSEFPVSPTFAVTAAIRSGNQSSTPVVNATVGELLYWTLDVPVEYTMLATLCTAYAGTNTSSNTSMLLITEGCSQEPEFVASFRLNQTLTYPAIPNIVRYWTTLWAFKFVDNDHIFIHCDLTFCPPASNACNMTCGVAWKRRAILKKSDPTLLYGSVSGVLRVVDVNPEFLYSPPSASTDITETTITAVAVLTSLVMLVLVIVGSLCYTRRHKVQDNKDYTPVPLNGSSS